MPKGICKGIGKKRNFKKFIFYNTTWLNVSLDTFDQYRYRYLIYDF